MTPDQESIFEKLPESRPGSRSPGRRPKAGEAASAEAKTAAQPKQARPKRASSPAKPAPAPPKAPAAADPGAKPGDGTGLDDLAWAGVAAAAEAATIGVRLANRAIEALRGSTERR